MVAHIDVCPLSVIPCPYAEIGCNFQVNNYVIYPLMNMKFTSLIKIFTYTMDHGRMNDKDRQLTNLSKNILD